MRTATFCAVLAAGLLLGFGGVTSALTIEFVDIGGAEEGSAILGGFQEAARFWESQIKDDVTVRIEIGGADYGPVWLGAAWVEWYLPDAPPSGWEWGGNLSPTYAAIKAALMADRTTAADFKAYDNLPTGPYMEWRTNTYDDAGHTIFAPDPGDVTTFIDTDTTGNNTRLLTTKAEAKALGMMGDDGFSRDGFIFLNTYYPFDYDRTDGIGSIGWDAFDFVGIATHEIAHQLGFISGVDNIDAALAGRYEPDYGWNVHDLNEIPWAVYSPLDLYRCSEEAMAAGLDVRDGAAGGNPYFSINGGGWNLGGFDIGYFYGGWQASHWKAPPDPTGDILGLMNPWLDYNMLAPFEKRDLLALDVIGWDVVPEPATFVLFGIAALGLGMGVRRRRRTA